MNTRIHVYMYIYISFESIGYEMAIASPPCAPDVLESNCSTNIWAWEQSSSSSTFKPSSSLLLSSSSLGVVSGLPSTRPSQVSHKMVDLFASKSGKICRDRFSSQKMAETVRKSGLFGFPLFEGMALCLWWCRWRWWWWWLWRWLCPRHCWWFCELVANKWEYCGNVVSYRRCSKL